MNVRVTQTHRATPVGKAGMLSLIASIEDPGLRQYCAEQLAAADTEEEVEATVRLIFELVAIPACLTPS